MFWCRGVVIVFRLYWCCVDVGLNVACGCLGVCCMCLWVLGMCSWGGLVDGVFVMVVSYCL